MYLLHIIYLHVLLLPRYTLTLYILCRRDDTHKDVVVRFCELKQKQYAEAATSTTTSYVLDASSTTGRTISPANNATTCHHQESRELLWQYLGLLVRQNGKLCSADLAGLLVTSATECDKRRPKQQQQDDDSLQQQQLQKGLERLAITDGTDADDESTSYAEGEEAPPQQQPPINTTASTSTTTGGGVAGDTTIGYQRQLLTVSAAATAGMVQKQSKQQLEEISAKITELVSLRC